MKLLRWDAAPQGVELAFSTRDGGVSEGPYASLNLGILTEDDPGRVVENRRRLCDAVGIASERATMAFQVHGTRITEARPTGVVTPGTDYEQCDGLWTDEPGQGLMLVTADCLPVALARTDGSRLVVLHAGWRGLLAGIAETGAAAADGETVAAIGPGIGPCCYEVGEEVAGPFRARFGDDVAPDGHLDLPLAAARALEFSGVKRVDRVGGCTACDPETYFSHRRDRGVTGRQGIVAALG
jgi:purine-nucleoside/S-methyl-5'-thioadenosine phosphorylase / adenosine deaminase